MLCHCSSTVTKDHFLVILYATEWPLCADVPLKLIHSIIHSCLSGVPQRGARHLGRPETGPGGSTT